ncbi:MAG: hypothetical protein AAGI14_10900 [Pseudomonadota bacterium]
MSNFSNIGFPVQTDEDLDQLIETIAPRCERLKTERGIYLAYHHESGASLWLQVDAQNSLIGISPHFQGTSRRRVGLIRDIDRGYSPLDGALYGWAEPQNEDAPEDTGSYPFVFDLPDRWRMPRLNLPQTVDVQLTASPYELQVYSDEAAYDASTDTGEPKFASESFVPSGLFISEDAPEGTQPESYGMFYGTVLSAEQHSDVYKGGHFTHLLVRTLGGEIDVVADDTILPETPQIGAIIGGSFWLSGRIVSDAKLDDPLQKEFKTTAKKKKRFGLF